MNFDLLHPSVPTAPAPPKRKLRTLFKEIMAARAVVAKDLKAACEFQREKVEHSFLPVKAVNTINAIWVRIKCLATQAKLDALGDEIKKTYVDVFSKIPHVDLLPNDIYARI